MKKIILLLLFSMLILGLPFLGIYLAGKDITLYLQFPPVTTVVAHHPFSWTAFIIITVIVLIFIVPFFLKIIKTPKVTIDKQNRFAFPWWGWLAICFGLLVWVIAWTRIGVFSLFQRWTFTPLWLSYIVTVNAVLYKRTGSCLIYDSPGFLAVLFPVSAVFWWFFEYLNRFVNNWYYVGVDGLTPCRYFLEASLAFSTVLPAVISTVQLLKTFPGLTRGLENFTLIKIPKTRMVAWSVLILSSLGLLGIAFVPDVLFPLLWVSPVLIMGSLRALFHERSIFSDCADNNYRTIILYAMAALVCGFFWEMWNMYSLAKWVYSVPYVHAFKIFEMPLLGYAGYLPFGMECAVIVHLFFNRGKGEWI